MKMGTPMSFEWFETVVHCQSIDKLRVQANEEARKIPWLESLDKGIERSENNFETHAERNPDHRSSYHAAFMCQVSETRIQYCLGQRETVQNPTRVYRCVRTFNISLLSLDFAWLWPGVKGSSICELWQNKPQKKQVNWNKCLRHVILKKNYWRRTLFHAPESWAVAVS